MDAAYFAAKKQKAKQAYQAQQTIYSPYFSFDITLNSDGFHHLQFSKRTERSKEEQLLKFSLLPLGLKIIRKATTLQEYRKLLCPVGDKLKLFEWWGFMAIFIDQGVKVKVVLRRAGDGNIAFWSVMPYSRGRR